MYKFLYCLVLFLFLMLGLFVVGGMLQANSPTRVYEDPATAQITACYQDQERIQHATTESHKAELMWWCFKRQYRTK
jgi:hypothetical protein